MCRCARGPRCTTPLRVQPGLICSAGCRAQGEDQKKLDILANEVFINLLTKCGQCAVLVSGPPPPGPLSRRLPSPWQPGQPVRKRARSARRTSSPPWWTRRAAATTASSSTRWCRAQRPAAQPGQAWPGRPYTLRAAPGRVLQHRLRREHRHHLRHLQARGGLRGRRPLRAAGAPAPPRGPRAKATRPAAGRGPDQRVRGPEPCVRGLEPRLRGRSRGARWWPRATACTAAAAPWC